MSRKKANQITQVLKNQHRAKEAFNVVPRLTNRRYALIALILCLIIVACTNTYQSSSSPLNKLSSKTTDLKIWWDKGSNLEEDEALKLLISNWEKASGKKVKLTFYTNDELSEKTNRALQAHNQPDIVMSSSAERELIPHLAWDGKLADISDVLEPVKSLYSDSVLEAVHFYNNVAKNRSYYAVPINQLTIHIHYWHDLLKQVGRSQKDIPKDWDAFWEFWKQVQDDLQAQPKQNQNPKIYGLGFPYSVASADTYYIFEQILEAYNVQILDSKGQLCLDDPNVRGSIVKSLDWYAKFYQQNYVPPDAVNWLNPDNNRSLLNHAVVMTPNTTLSIPAAVRQNPEIYRHQLGTIPFPNKPNGQPMRYLVAVNAAILFAESDNQKTAKEFFRYLVQPSTIGNYIKAAGGRYLPVMKPNWKDPFWTNPNDPHISTAAKTLIEGSTRPFYIVQNPAYSRVLKDNVWGKALNRIVVDKISSEQAADEAIARIKQIFDQWQ